MKEEVFEILEKEEKWLTVLKDWLRNEFPNQSR
jgi:hypothetical protein